MTSSRGLGPGGGEPSPPPGRLGVAEPPVVLSGVATGAPFLLEGEQVALVGNERRGEHAVWVGGEEVLSGLRTDAGLGVNLVVGPATLRRELLGARGTILETTLAVPALPLAAIQWEEAAGAPPGTGLEVTFSLLPDREAPHHEVRDGALFATADGELSAAVRIHPPPIQWTVVEGTPRGLGVRASIAGPGPVTLIVAAGHPSRVARALGAAPHLGGHEIRAAAEADPADPERFTTDTGVAELDHGLVWATARVRGAGRPGRARDAGGAFWAGLGALAVGDADAATRCTEVLWGLSGSAVDWPIGPPVASEALATLLAARTTLLSGDPAPAQRSATRLDEATLEGWRRRSDAAAWSVWSRSLSWLADALRDGAPDQDIDRLRASAARPPGSGGRPLPMAGQAPATGPGDVLHALLAGGSAGPMQLQATSPLGCWAAWSDGRADEAYAAWRGLLGRGLAGEPHGRGSWDPIPGRPGGAPAAGQLLCALSHGLLGLTPDAPSGRIRVAPAFPTHLTGFTVRGIRVGEARFTLRYERDGALCRLTLEPTRGRVPPMAILEPSLPLAEVRSLRIDGSPAELPTTRVGERTRVQVQLPLDGVRVLEALGPE